MLATTPAPIAIHGVEESMKFVMNSASWSADSAEPWSRVLSFCKDSIGFSHSILRVDNLTHSRWKGGN